MEVPEIRCRKCSKLLFKGRLGLGTNLEHKCGSCRTLNTWVVQNVSDNRLKLEPDGMGGLGLNKIDRVVLTSTKVDA